MTTSTEKDKAWGILRAVIEMAARDHGMFLHGTVLDNWEGCTVWVITPTYEALHIFSYQELSQTELSAAELARAEFTDKVARLAEQRTREIDE